MYLLTCACYLYMYLSIYLFLQTAEDEDAANGRNCRAQNRGWNAGDAGQAHVRAAPHYTGVNPKPQTPNPKP